MFGSGLRQTHNSFLSRTLTFRAPVCGGGWKGSAPWTLSPSGHVYDPHWLVRGLFAKTLVPTDRAIITNGVRRVRRVHERWVVEGLDRVPPSTAPKSTPIHRTGFSAWKIVIPVSRLTSVDRPTSSVRIDDPSRRGTLFFHRGG